MTAELACSASTMLPRWPTRSRSPLPWTRSSYDRALMGSSADADDDADEVDGIESDDELDEDDVDEELEELEEDDEDEEHPEPEVTIEISGLSIYTHMGVTEAEREVGQRLLIDIRLDIGQTDATITDR